jgi:hypothetical protein
LYYYQAYQFLKNIPHERQDVLSSQNLDNLMATKIKPLFGGGLHLNCDYGESYISYLPMGDAQTVPIALYFLQKSLESSLQLGKAFFERPLKNDYHQEKHLHLPLEGRISQLK